MRAATNWTEAYNLTDSAWNVANGALPGPRQLPPATLAALADELWRVAACALDSCP